VRSNGVALFFISPLQANAVLRGYAGEARERAKREGAAHQRGPTLRQVPPPRPPPQKRGGRVSLHVAFGAQLEPLNFSVSGLRQVGAEFDPARNL